MFAGKTTEILRRCQHATQTNKHVVVVKYGHDNRYSENAEIINHNGQQISNTDYVTVIKAITIDDILTALYKPTIQTVHGVSSDEEVSSIIDILIIDEAQFFTGIYDCISHLMTDPKFQHLDIVISGLDLDAKGHIFNTDFNMLIAIADETIYKLARCYICSKTASYTIRLDNDLNSQQVQIGGSDIYQPVCHEHHDI